MKKILMSVLVFGASANEASAHPGEHVMSALQSVGHLLTEPDHLVFILLTAVVAGVLIYKRRRAA